MTMQDLSLLYEYNYWATKRVLDASATLTPEEFRAPAVQSWGSLRGTLVHTLDTELGWRTLIQAGTSATVDLSEAEFPRVEETKFPTVEALRARWLEDEREMRAYLAGLRDDSLTRIVRYTTEKGETRERLLWYALYHVVNHGTYHRSEAATILKGYGRSHGGIDFTLFLTATGVKPST